MSNLEDRQARVFNLEDNHGKNLLLSNYRRKNAEARPAEVLEFVRK